MSDLFKFAQLQPFSLAGAGAVIGDTSIILKSFQTIDGVDLAMTDFGDVGYMTLEPGNGTLEEQISFSGVVQNANGTATLSGVKSVLFVYPYTETSGLAKTHAGSTTAIVSNTAGFYNKLTSKSDDETITGTWTFTNPNYPRMDTDTPYPTDNEQLATKAYADSLTFAGAPDMSLTQKGIAEEASAAEINAGTQTGGTGAELAVNPKYLADSIYGLQLPTSGQKAALAGTSGTPGSGNKYVTNDDTGTTVTPGLIVRRLASTGGIALPSTPTNSTDAASKAYVDGGTYRLYTNGIATRVDTTASGSQTIAHGLGRTPKYIRITAVDSAGTSEIIQSTGSYNGTTTSSVFINSANTENGTADAVAGSSTTNIITIGRNKIGAVASQVATATFDATNITLAWTLSGTMPGNTIGILWEAE